MEGKWKVGDKCMAPFSGDGSLYKAVIRKIAEDVDGNKMAEVWYKGYLDDDNELVQIDDLKEIPRLKKLCEKSSSKDTDFESPLFNYISEDDRIRAQYADMYDDPRPVSRPTCSTGAGKKTTSPKAKGSKVTAAGKKRKGTVAFGGDVKASQKPSMVNKPRKAPIVSSSNVDVSSREEWNIADLEEGFSAKDVEKPYFPGKSDISATKPLILSGSDKKPLMQVPGTINRYLREYQRDGIRFLYSHYKNDNGAILGDDMGLGKTVQVIAFIAAVLGMTGGREDLERRLPEFLQKESPQKPGTRPKTFLIICPNSVLYNWLDEFETWTHCIVARYHGKERDDTLRRARRGRLDAVLTTYETYRLYLDDLLTVSWDAVFVDEVHKIKEPTALITQALKDINTNKRYGLTGTALQNKMGELWCVLDWANPGCLGGWREFKQEYEQIIKTGQKYNASKRELADARQVAKRFALLRSKWMIRRTKALIAHQLPSKDERVAFCNLSSFQLDVYRALLESEDMKLVLEQKNPCDCRSGLKRGRCCYKRNDRGEGITSLTFGLMSLLIKVSNHIALLMPYVSKSEKQREKAQRYCEIAFAKQPQFVDLSREARFATLSDPTYCGKMQVLEKLLRVFKRENSKVLLFSCYTQLLDILEMFMKTTSYTYRRLDGKTPAQDRQKFVHEFNKDPDIFLFLISTKAGGIGLNLTGANVVVIFDPNWNPTYDLQAQDRAYRIGQHRDVRVYRLISRGSIEENMYLRQLYKQQLASVAVTTENAKRYFTAVAGDREQQGEIFGLHNLFALRGDGSCLTKDVIQREEKTELGITMAKYKPQTSVEEKAKDLLEELLEEEERDDKTREVGEEDEDEDDDDMHGMASQLPEVDDEEEDDDDGSIHSNSSEMEEVEGRMNSKKLSPEKSRMRSALTKSANNQDYRDDTDEDEGDEWKGQLRKLVSGKAILGKDGQPVQKVKGQRRGGAQSNSLHNNQRVSQTSARVEEEEEEDGKETREEKRPRGRKEDAGTYRGHKIHRMDSGSIKTAEDVFKTCGIEYVHSNMKVVGASHIEDHVSKVAQRDVFEIGQFSQEPAYCQVPTLDMETVTSNHKPKTAQRKTPSLPRVQSQATSHRLGETTLLVGQTPIGVRRDQFKDMASVLDFSSPSDLASHIQGLSNEDCLKLLLSYHQAKHGMDFKEFLKLPAKPSIDPKLARNTRADRGSGEKQESALDETRIGGRGRGRRRDSGAKRRVASRSRKASVGLKFESSSSGDDSFHIDSDDMEGTHGSVGKSVIRTKFVKQEREKENLKERRKRIGGGMISHEVYKEIFDEDSSDGLDAGYDDAKIQRTGAGNRHTDFSVQENARKCNQSVRSTDKGNDDVKNVVCDPHRKHKTLREESKGDASSTARPKREDSLSFLDDIFLSDSGTPRRRPPPKKHVARRDKAVITTSESDSIFGAESITDDSSGILSRSVVGEDKNCGDRATPGSGIFTRSNLTLETDIVMETIDGEDRDLWKRNDTFLPRHTFFEETEDSEDSVSMFVANPMFKSESGAIT